MAIAAGEAGIPATPPLPPPSMYDVNCNTVLVVCWYPVTWSLRLLGVRLTVVSSQLSLCVMNWPGTEEAEGLWWDWGVMSDILKHVYFEFFFHNY